MDTILSILSGGISGALLVLLLRGWISERLRQAIRHEYAQKLETHKAELNSRITLLSHEYRLRQLRTSMFFDHQRQAFADVLSTIAETKKDWFNASYTPEKGMTAPVPTEAYQKLLDTYYRHQLFLDSDCIASIELIIDTLRESFPFDDGSGVLQQRKIGPVYERLEYLQPRLAELFQQKIGVETSRQAEKEIALLGSILLLNRYHFRGIGLPVKGNLDLKYRDRAADAVAKAATNLQDLIAKLEQFQNYLRDEGHGVFHEAATSITRYLAMLGSEEKEEERKA
jgi:hypothetical protein